MKDEPFSFAVPVRDIPREGRHYRLAADNDQCSALAGLLKIPAVEALEAELNVRPALGSAYRIRGSFRATVIQTDVVSLDPVRQEVAEDVDVTLMEAGDVAPGRRPKEVLVDAVEVDGPDLFHDGRIDLGVIVREHLALGLDPYPRAPGTTFPGHIEDDPSADPSPFAALAALKPRGD